MKLVFFDDFKLGVVKDETVVDVSGAVSGIAHTSPQDLINKVIENFSQHRAALQQAVDSGQGTPLRLRSPLPKPPNIICMAVNYMEDGTREEPAPINAFQKSPNSVIGDGDTMVLPDIPATIFEGEAEMALVIGKRASNVRPEDAFDYIFGYLNFIDGSARWVTSIHELEPGDVIATGTNHRGLSALQNDDKVELEVQGLGTLHFNLRDDLKRTWPRTTRLEMTEQGKEGTTPQATGKYA